MSRKFHFPSGAWVVAENDYIELRRGKPILTDYSKAVTRASNHGKAVPLFSDDDLAKRFIEAADESGFAAATFLNKIQLVKFLKEQRDLGTAQVALDPTFGHRFVVTTPIEKAIKDVRRS